MSSSPTGRRRLYVSAALVAGSAAWIAFGRPGHQPILPTASWSQLSMPQTPAGQQVAGYLRAFNSGDENLLTSFVQASFSEVGPGGSTLDSRLRSQKHLYNSSRGLNVFRVEEAGPEQVELLVQFRLTEQWRQMTFTVEGTSPYRITGVRIVPVEAPAIPQVIARRAFPEELQDYLARLVDADQFSGVVSVVRRGEIVFEGSYGFADHQAKLTNTLETPFQYASVGKMFTAVAIGQLAQAGHLNLDDTLDTYLSDYPAEVARRVTVDHLLTHRSGIPDFFEAEQFETVRHSDNPQRDYLRVFAGQPLRFAPGERFEYSNSNFILLGAIVERLSGLPFAEYLEQRIFNPAGMTATTLDPAGRSAVSPATGQTELQPDGTTTPGQRRSNSAYTTARGSAAGGGVTTAGDMIRFAQALLDDKLLSPEMTNTLLAEQVDGPRPGERYARGFIIRDSRQGQIFGHSGGFPGVDAQIDIYRNGWIVVVLANYEAVGEPVARYIEQRLAAENDEK